MTDAFPPPITRTDDLIAAVEVLARGDFLCVDTEFHRETTYWPVLCLIQAAGPGGEFVIDPLAEGMDLTPFLQLIADASRVKVFHAARQDLEIFTRLIGTPPGPVFDTQIAAMALGLGDSISYDSLVQQLVGVSIDKSSQFTDWIRRPLTPKQLTYAMGDVTHLRTAYVKMREALRSKGRESWVASEMAELCDPELYDTDPAKAWQRLKLRRPKRDYLAALVAIAAWREATAQASDKPRRRILQDDAIQELAEQRPRDAEALERLRAVPNGFSRSRLGQELLKVIADAVREPERFAPVLEKEVPRNPAPPGATDMLKVLLKTVSDEAGLAPRLIANASDLEAIAQGRLKETACASGWRRELFGARAEALLEGRLAVRFNKGEVAFFDLPAGS
jgi:ribonuclease D